MFFIGTPTFVEISATVPIIITIFISPSLYDPPSLPPSTSQLEEGLGGKPNFTGDPTLSPIFIYCFLLTPDAGTRQPLFISQPRAWQFPLVGSPRLVLITINPL